MPNSARIAAFRSEPLEIRMFYVGHGEAILIVFPDRLAWIVEVGSSNGWPDNNTLGTRLAKYLSDEGLTLDAMIMAHAHKDHVGAVPALLEAGVYNYTSPLRQFRNESSSWDRKRTKAGNWSWHDAWWRRVKKDGDVEDMNRPGFTGDSISWEDGFMNKSTRYSPEVRERADCPRYGRHFEASR